MRRMFGSISASSEDSTAIPHLQQSPLMSSQGSTFSEGMSQSKKWFTGTLNRSNSNAVESGDRSPSISNNNSMKLPWANRNRGAVAEQDNETMEEIGIRPEYVERTSSVSTINTIVITSDPLNGSALKLRTKNTEAEMEARRGQDMIIELLSGEAQFQVRSFEVMDFVEFEKLKKVRLNQIDRVLHNLLIVPM
jgi:hypothetical protein